MLLLITLLLLAGCSKSEVLIEMPKMESADTIYTPKTKVQDTIKRHPIKFDVYVIDWEEYFN